MPQSLDAVYLHAVFSTRGRHPWLADADLRSKTFAYMGRVSSGLGCTPILVGGVRDHVHVLARLSRTVTIAAWIRELKKTSNQMIREHGGVMKDFAWQAGYGVFAVERHGLQEARGYIEAQEEHHRQLSFQDEFRSLLREHGLEWDEQYVWE